MQKRSTRRGAGNQFIAMSTEPAQTAESGQMEKFTTPLSLVIDAILVIAFFVFMFFVIRPHVQSENPLFIAIWGGGSAACMSGVFWLAIQMFRVVFRAQREARRAK